MLCGCPRNGRTENGGEVRFSELFHIALPDMDENWAVVSAAMSRMLGPGTGREARFRGMSPSEI